MGNPAMLSLLSKRLLQPDTLPPSRYVANKMIALESRVKKKKAENEGIKLFKMAESLHATSFRYRDVSNIANCDLQRCINANEEAVKKLREAIDMGNMQARACLADMLLNGKTLGVRKDVHDIKDVREAVELVSHIDDPDCQGVLAHWHFNNKNMAGPDLASTSAARGSKYGQYVVGLYEMQKKDAIEAAKYFTLAAEQNYEEAQISLSKLQNNTVSELRLLNLAADQGNVDAFYTIFGVYLRKSSNPHTVQFMDAMAWCILAMKAKHPYAKDELRRMQLRLGW